MKRPRGNLKRFFLRESKVFGGYGGGETPLPISNREVKPSSADGTARVTLWESRSLPRLNF